GMLLSKENGSALRPGPVAEVLNQRQPVAVAVNRLAADGEAVPDVGDVVQIDDPDPGTLALHGRAGLAVPLDQLPIFVGLLGGQGLHGGLEIAVGDLALVALGVVVVLQQRAFAAVEVVGLVGTGGAPAHQDRLGEHLPGNLVPAQAPDVDLNADGPELLGSRHAHGLPDRVAGRVEAVKFRLEAVFFHNAVAVGVGPAAAGQ